MYDASPGEIQLPVALCDVAPSEQAVGSVGAGPLKTLLFENGRAMATAEGAGLLEALVTASRQSPAPSQAEKTGLTATHASSVGPVLSQIGT
jgi:hypothetical protein